MSAVEIRTDRLLLRPLVGADADDLHRLWTDPEVRRFLWDDEVISRERVTEIIETSEQYFREYGFGLWGVSLHGDDAIVGFCGYWFFHDPPELQVLFGITPKWWGRGLATEAARTMIRYGFEELGLVRVVGSADAPNTASHRVMENAGMVCEKRLRINGRDTLFYETEQTRFEPDGSRFVVRRAPQHPQNGEDQE